MPESLTRLSALSSVIVRWFASLGLLLITAIIAWQVFARYVLNASPSWAEQAALLLLIWYVMFAAAAGVREGFHIRISVFVDGLPHPYRHWATIAMHALVGIFGVVMTWSGVELAVTTWTHVIPALGISRAFAYVPMSLAGILIAAYSIEHIVSGVTGKAVDHRWN
jgi:TRAP-type C4-dicarboxylate transport system permease small subunit